MKITRLEKILLALLLAGSLAFVGIARAEEQTYTIYTAKKEDSSGKELYTVTVTVNADNSKTETHTFTDVNGESHTYYTNSTVTTPTVTITSADESVSSDLSDLSLSYTSPNITQETSESEIKYKYYAWTEDGFVKVQDASSANVTVSYVESEIGENGIYNFTDESTYNGQDISADFVGLSFEGRGAYDLYGGAINNLAIGFSASLGTITGNFIGNYEGDTLHGGYGGAIANCTKGEYTASIKAINGNFVGNYATTGGENQSSYGGAICNSVLPEYLGGTAEIGKIEGDFIGNYAKAGSAAYGGAICNSVSSDNESYPYFDRTATIGEIKGNFIGNYATADHFAYGGAIYNSVSTANKASTATIEKIEGDFIGNHVYANNVAEGGAVYNTGEIGSITGDFIGNYAKANYRACGGAIYNSVTSSTDDEGITTYSAATISSISGIFIGNYAESDMPEESAAGGAIYNTGTFSDIHADFIGNYAKSEDAAKGGAIFNTKTSAIGAYGKTIYSAATISSIAGDFIGNHVESTASYAYGGAIYNENGTIGDIAGDFIGNYAKARSLAYGGAIYNSGSGLDDDLNVLNSRIESITGDFIGNHADSTGNHAYGGAIYNDSNATIGDIAGDFIGNYATSTGTSTSSLAWGGAIYNNGGSINSIKGNFIDNYATSTANDSFGGAIYNEGTIGVYDAGTGKATVDGISGSTFQGNTATQGGAIYNGTDKSGSYTSGTYNGIISSITDSWFIGNKATNYGGAIYNYDDGAIYSIDNCYFMENVAQNGNGGAIENAESDAIIGDMSGNTFVNNKATGNGGAIYNEGTIGTVDETTEVTGGISNSTFTGNSAEANGGAIYNEGTIGTITNSSFINNTAGEKGGAIYSASDLNIVADGASVVFRGNSDGTDDNAIYMAAAADGTASNLSFSLKNGGTIYMYDNIKGEGNYSVDISGTGLNNTFFLMNDVNAVSDENEISPASIKLYADDNTTDATTNNADLSVGGVTLYTTLYTLSDEAHVYKTNSFTLTGDFDMYADVDFKNEVMDHFETNNDGEGSLTDDSADENGHNGTLNVAGMNGLTDTEADRLAVYFAESGLMKNVKSSAGTVYAPIFTYNANYVYLDGDEGEQKIYDANGNEYDVSSSELFSSGDYEDAGYFVFDKTGYNPAAMATSVASMATYGFMSMMFEYNFEHSDYYMKLPEETRLALAQEQQKAKKSPKESDATRPEYYNRNELTYRGAWMRSFFSNESVNYGGGWNSRDKYYGAMVGFDSNMHVSKNGWANVTTGYAGTLGIRQEYDGGHIKQHGGFVGLTESFYKKNFYTAWTIAAGTNKAHEHTMYGKDTDRIDNYGIAARFGWNIDMDYNGKFAILPTFTASYSYVNPEDFVNAAGTNIHGSGFRALQLNPNVKFIWKMNDGWQPYLTVGEVWTVGDSSHIYADQFKLDELDLKPYTEYGLGVQKRWADEKDAYIQLLGHSDGRDGILVNAGVRWNF